MLLATFSDYKRPSQIKSPLVTARENFYWTSEYISPSLNSIMYCLNQSFENKSNITLWLCYSFIKRLFCILWFLAYLLIVSLRPNVNYFIPHKIQLNFVCKSASKEIYLKKIDWFDLHTQCREKLKGSLEWCKTSCSESQK